jgi:hypothetical protein
MAVTQFSRMPSRLARRGLLATRLMKSALNLAEVAKPAPIIARMLILQQRYEYVPAGGDPKSPIVIAGLQDFPPDQSREKVTVWRFDVPHGFAVDLPSGLKVDTWKDVIQTLKRCFPNETDEGLRERLRNR